KTRVQMGEHGGITQHLSAYRVDSGDKHVVFIDTPGHKAFTEMRARGANITDVAVLVVAADDGVMPQTQEAIQHAQAANISIVVAINKIDKANANVMRTKQQLAEIGLSPPDWGGSTEMVEVSALTDLGIDDLLELLTLETEILELRANPDKEGIGTVLDARATQGLGNVATVLIQEGTLRPGDHVICGSAQGKVRMLQTTTGIPLEAAGPSTPVELTGLDELPEAGDRLYALSDVSKIKAIAEDRKRQRRALDRARRRQHITLEGLSEFLAKSKIKEVNLIVKADVKGSLEVLRKQLTDLSTEEVGIRIIGEGIGAITESDVLLADASNAVVIGFGVAANDRARRQAEESNVEIRTYQVIYQIIEEMKLSLEGLLDPELYEEAQATVEVQEVFTSSRLGKIAGCIVRSGVFRREDPVRLAREGKIIYEGKLDSLKRFKDDTKEVKEGFECGCRIAGYSDIKVGDSIESYKILKKARTLDQSK
ncbi:MAG: translation initiation factor IF-2, partial [Planctomycetota bacterium]